MRKALFTVLLVPLLSLLPRLTAASPDLIGRWKLTAEFAEAVPANCKDAYVEVSESSVTAFSGTQMITASYRVSRMHGDFVMTFSDIRVNEEPNCQGIAPEVVRKNFAALQIWRKEGDIIKVLAPKLIMELERT